VDAAQGEGDGARGENASEFGVLGRVVSMATRVAIFIRDVYESSVYGMLRLGVMRGPTINPRFFHGP